MGLQNPVPLFNKSVKIMFLSRLYRDMLNIRAIFSDETETYRTPVEPMEEETVVIRIRTAKNNADAVYLQYDTQGEEQKLEMKKEYTEGLFDFYKVEVPPCKEEKQYYFSIVFDGRTVYYSKYGVSNVVNHDFDFRILRNFKTPDWAKGAVMYQIFPDRFCNGDTTNDIKDYEYIYLGRPTRFVADWYELPESDDIRNFHGGDLQGVIDKLSYLQELGIEVIYFNPLFVSPSNHKYDIQDYDYIDPHLGVVIQDGGSPLTFEKFHNRYATMYIERTTNKLNLEASNALFIKLVSLAHQKGIRVILDGVFNHCGAFNKWLDREGFYHTSGNYPVGAYKDKNSIYNKFFRWYDQENWPNNDCYDGWWGYDNHPKLNYEASEELCQYILDVAKKWVSPPYNADGWRLDVAADLGYSEEFNHKFWQKFRKVVKEGNPEAIILAEHYGDASSWLRGDQWDTVMNYDAFMEPLSYFLTGMEKHSESYNGDLFCNGAAFVSAMKWNMSRLSVQSLYTAMNELSNHDHSRFLTRTNRKVGRLHTVGPQAAEEGIHKGIMREAVAFQMTWPGSPTVYYGDEASLCGWTDPDNRRAYPWGREDKEMIAFHKAMIHIHKSSQTFRTGSVEFLYTDYGIISYARFDRQDKFIILLNNNAEVRECEIPVWQAGVAPDGKLLRLLVSDAEGFQEEKEFFALKNGQLSIALPPYSVIICKEVNDANRDSL